MASGEKNNAEKWTIFLGVGVGREGLRMKVQWLNRDPGPTGGPCSQDSQLDNVALSVTYVSVKIFWKSAVIHNF